MMKNEKEATNIKTDRTFPPMVCLPFLFYPIKNSN